MDEFLKFIALHLRVIGWKYNELENDGEFNCAIERLELLAFRIEFNTLLHGTTIIPIDIININEFITQQLQLQI